MKVKCLECGYVGESAIPPPALSRDGREYQAIPAYAKCRSGRITRLG